MSRLASGTERGEAPKSARLLSAAALLAGALLVVSPTLRAQEVTVEGQARGTLTVKGEVPFDAGVTSPARRRAANATIDRLLTILRADPGVAHPVGYDITIDRVMGRAKSGYDVGAAYHAGVDGYVWQIAARSDGHGGREVIDAGKLPFAVLTNTAWCAGEFADSAADGGPPIVEGSRETGQLHGHPVYDGQCILITSRPVPPFVPVTRERYLRLQILGLEKQLVKQRKENAQVRAATKDPAMLAMFDSSVKVFEWLRDSTKAELDTMSPAERAKPAWVRHPYPNDVELVDAGTDGAEPLLSENPALFDAKLPPDQPQVIALLLPFAQPGVAPKGVSEDPSRRANMQAIVRGLDWAALEAMVH